MFCNKCGQQLPEFSIICYQCGNDLAYQVQLIPTNQEPSTIKYKNPIQNNLDRNVLLIGVLVVFGFVLVGLLSGIFFLLR